MWAGSNLNDYLQQRLQILSGENPGLIDVTVEIPAGEFMFLIGPSGSGKTTFLRLLIRDLLLSKGTITVDNEDISNYTGENIHLLRRKVGIVFQDFKLLLDRTVFENIAMVLEILGKPEADIEQGVMNVLELVGLGGETELFSFAVIRGRNAADEYSACHRRGPEDSPC